jgi:hypothetical protein
MRSGGLKMTTEGADKVPCILLVYKLHTFLKLIFKQILAL